LPEPQAAEHLGDGFAQHVVQVFWPDDLPNARGRALDEAGV
jgi:hypothetical protein